MNLDEFRKAENKEMIRDTAQILKKEEQSNINLNKS